MAATSFRPFLSDVLRTHSYVRSFLVYIQTWISLRGNIYFLRGTTSRFPPTYFSKPECLLHTVIYRPICIMMCPRRESRHPRRTVGEYYPGEHQVSRTKEGQVATYKRLSIFKTIFPPFLPVLNQLLYNDNNIDHRSSIRDERSPESQGEAAKDDYSGGRGRRYGWGQRCRGSAGGKRCGSFGSEERKTLEPVGLRDRVSIGQRKVWRGVSGEGEADALYRRFEGDLDRLTSIDCGMVCGVWRFSFCWVFRSPRVACAGKL